MGDGEIVLVGESKVARDVLEGYTSGSVSLVGGDDVRDCDRRLSPSAVVIDADASRVTIPETIETAFGRWSGPPIVVCGELLTEDRASEAIAAGANQFLLASIVDEPDQVRSLLDRAIATRDVDPSLVEDHRQYRTIVETIPEGVVVFDANRTIVDVNRTAAELYGRTTDELVGSSLAELCDAGLVEPETMERHEDVVEELRETNGRGAVGTYEFTVTFDDGTARRYESRVAIRPSDDGIDRGTISVLRDVTEERDRLAELERVETIVDSLPDMVWTTDETGSIEYLSDGTNQVLDSTDAATAVDEPAMLTEETRDRMREAAATVLAVATEETHGSFEFTMETVDGTRFPARTYLSIMTGEDGNPVGVAGISRDISDRKRRKRRLQVLSRVLRHNLRNDLGKITGYAELLGETTTESGVLERTRTIRTIATQLSDVATKARRLQETIKTDRFDDESIDLATLVSQVTGTVSQEYSEVTIEWTVPTPCPVYGTDDLSLVLQEVLENALAHNETASPHLEVTAERRDDIVTLRLLDNRSELTEEERSMIADGDSTEWSHEDGLGRWVVQWILEQQQGEIDVVTLPSHGNVVEITLQAADR
jgi:PAS domain S-box-containing protein